MTGLRVPAFRDLMRFSFYFQINPKRGKDDASRMNVDPDPNRRCATCGELGHMRSSSKLCREYKAKAVNARRPENIEQEAKVTSKISAGKFFQDPRVVAVIRDNIVPRMSAINAEATRACIGFVLHRLEAGLHIPNLSMGRGGVMRQFFAGMLANRNGDRNTGRDQDVNVYIDRVYTQLRPAGRPWYDGSNLAQLITYQANMYAANCCAHVTVNLPRLLQRYIDNELRRLIRYPEFPRRLFKILTNTIITMLMDEAEFGLGEDILARIRAANINLTVAVTVRVWWLWWSIKNNFLRGASLSAESVKQSWWRYLPAMHALRLRVEEHNALSEAERVRQGRPKWNQKTFSILPVPNFQQKHVLIDSIGLYDILTSAEFIYGNRNQHLADLDNFWNTHAHMNRATTRNRRFAFTISTDGVSVSVHLRRPSYPAPQADRWGYRRQDEERIYVPVNIDQDDRVVGLDPGRKSLFGACWGPNAEHTCTMSNGQWQEMAGHHFSNHQHKKWRRQNPEIQRLISNVPTWKSVTHHQHAIHTTYVLGHLDQLLGFYRPPKYRRLRWKTYLRREKAYDKLTNQLAGGVPHNHVVIGYGGGRFDHASPGWAPTPRVGLFKHLRRKFWRTRLVCEHNTSQFCCRDDTRLREFGNNWASRKCHFCNTIWNRDVNAARNIRSVFLVMNANEGRRPWPFGRHRDFDQPLIQ